MPPMPLIDQYERDRLWLAELRTLPSERLEQAIRTELDHWKRVALYREQDRRLALAQELQ